MLRISGPLIPTPAQWRQWSLPSRLTFLGAVAGVMSIVMSLVLSRWPLTVGGSGDRIPLDDVAHGESPMALSSESARDRISAMVHDFPGSSPIRIRSITSPVNGVAAVAIEPPYREFPNVVLFRFEDGPKRWRRILEGLTIGIDPDVSHVLDVHTIGEAIDFERPTPSDERTWMVDHGYSSGWVPVSYDKFLHVHPSGAESYYLDKRDFGRLARKLLPTVNWVDTECTLFDLPDIYRISLSHSSGRFELLAQTVNDQEWTVTFTGTDGDEYLAHKVVDARVVKR